MTPPFLFAASVNIYDRMWGLVFGNYMDNLEEGIIGRWDLLKTLRLSSLLGIDQLTTDNY